MDPTMSRVQARERPVVGPQISGNRTPEITGGVPTTGM